MDKYTNILHGLLPTGLIWDDLTEDSNLLLLLGVLAFRMEQTVNDSLGVLDDVFPDSNGNFVTDWERVLDLPREGIIDQTFTERVGTVMAWLNISPYSTPAFLIEIARLMGFDITITTAGGVTAVPMMATFATTTAGESVTVPTSSGFSYNGQIDFTPLPSTGLLPEQIQINSALQQAPIYWRSGEARSGDRLVEYQSNDALESLLMFFRPAGSELIFNYT